MSQDYEYSRKYFIYEGCMAVGIASLTSGVFLTGYANYMGASDEFNGIIAAIPAATGVIQLFSSMVFEKLARRKFVVALGSFIFRFFLSVMLLISMVIHDTTTKLALLVIVYSMACLISSFINPPASNWLVDLTPEQIRGSYFARRDAISLGFLTVLTVIMGRVMDLFKEYHLEYGGFLILGAIALTMTFLDAYYLSKIREPFRNRKTVTVNMRDAILKPFTNKKYRTVIFLFLLWNIGIQIGGPFYMVYMVTGLKLSYTNISILGVLSSLVRVFAAKYWGRFADHMSWVLTTKISIVILAICHLGWLLVDSKTIWIYLPILLVWRNCMVGCKFIVIQHPICDGTRRGENYVSGI